MRVRLLLICGFCLLASNWSQQSPAAGAPATPRHYRQLVADSDIIKALRDKLDLLSPLAASQLRPSILTEPGDWNTCVRVSSSGFKTPPEPPSSDALAARQRPALPMMSYYAFFFVDQAIVDSRPAVIIDRCGDMTYLPLPQPSKKKKPD